MKKIKCKTYDKRAASLRPGFRFVAKYLAPGHFGLNEGYETRNWTFRQH